jgi:hypothetical protein
MKHPTKLRVRVIARGTPGNIPETGKLSAMLAGRDNFSGVKTGPLPLTYRQAPFMYIRIQPMAVWVTRSRAYSHAEAVLTGVNGVRNGGGP